MRMRLVAREDTSDADPPGEYLCQGNAHNPKPAEFLVPVGARAVLPLCLQHVRQLFSSLESILGPDSAMEVGR